MKADFQLCLSRITILMIPLLALIACTASPASPTVSSPQVDLTAKESVVEVIGSGNTETGLEKNNVVNLQVDDRIRLDERGQGLIQIPDQLEVGLFRRTEIHLADVKQETGGSTSVRLYQTYGNVEVRLEEGALSWVTLETEYATFRTLEQGTKFVVCHKPGAITCGVVNQGLVEVTAQGKKEIAKEGEAIYVRPGQPPSPPICAIQDDVSDWLNRIQGTGSVAGLGEIVAGWPQEPCSPPAPETSPPEITALPSAAGMVKIEAGPYVVGRSEPDENHVAVKQIDLKEYWIDQYEVTNAQYQIFVQAAGHQPPANGLGEENHPVKGVSWDDASAYCAWAGKRLPTEAEWEVAGRGSGEDPPLYPWGDDGLAEGKVSDLPRDETYEVGSFPFNQSTFGVYDMAGNVWEWVGDPYEPLPSGSQLLRGGRHGLIRDMAYRQPAEPDRDRFVPFAGFRCATDQVEGG